LPSRQSQHAHPEAELTHAGNLAAHRANPEDKYRLSDDLEQGASFGRIVTPATVALILEEPWEVARQRQHQRHDVLGHEHAHRSFCRGDDQVRADDLRRQQPLDARSHRLNPAQAWRRCEEVRGEAESRHRPVGVGERRGKLGRRAGKAHRDSRVRVPQASELVRAHDEVGSRDDRELLHALRFQGAGREAANEVTHPEKKHDQEGQRG
jgi:hypothetical protein